MNIKQYPHYLFAVNAVGDSVQDENGNWVDTPATNVFISKCREDANGGGSEGWGKEMRVAGGVFHKASSFIQLPKGAQKQGGQTPPIQVGSAVFVANNADGSDIRIEGVVLRYDVGQLHNRLWV